MMQAISRYRDSFLRAKQRKSIPGRKNRGCVFEINMMEEREMVKIGTRARKRGNGQFNMLRGVWKSEV